MLTHIRSVIAITLAGYLCSCAPVHTLEQGEKLSDNSQQIRVYLYDNRKIDFAPGAYTINPLIDSAYLRGIGNQRLLSTVDKSEFDGAIRFQDIKNLEVVGPKEFPMVLVPIMFGAALIVAVLLDPFKKEPIDAAR